MKSDLQLQEDVAEELAFDPSVDATEIAVAAKGGVVTLSGTVGSYAERLAAERAAKRVAGVIAIAEGLRIELRTFHERTDVEIAAAAVSILRWDVTIPPQAISVKVETGWVTLEGRVDWQFQRENAERAVAHLAGVKGVTNLIGVTPRPQQRAPELAVTGADVKQKIRRSFERSAEIDAGRIAVETSNGTVTLRGTVHSWFERDEVLRAAYSVPGVRRVENLTTVT